MARQRYILFSFLGLLIVLSLRQFAYAQTPAITLTVDATDAPRKILHAKETITTQPGPLTLFYPKWIPGEHGPTGPVVDLVGLKIESGGKPVSWRRDLEEMYSIHCDAPAGANQIDLTFDFVLPPDAMGFSSGASSSAQLLVLSWNQVILYPLDRRPDDILVAPGVKLPSNWKFGTALEADPSRPQSGDGTVFFKPVSLGMLVDSPVLSSAHFRRIDISAGTGTPHFLNLASDGDAAIEMSEGQIEAHRRLVIEANALFGAHHYHHYDFLYTLSDQVAHFGLEHHQSSDDRVAEQTLIDDNYRKLASGLLPHEFVHSWNGKYRRPAGLATGDFSTPMKGELLWVYEGLTQYLGKILAARSTLRTPEDYREDLALLAARLDTRPGREWRPLQDAADEAQLLYNARGDWDSYRRRTDFYDESNLIWLETDVTIRQLTKGKKNLDDFCMKFHGGTTAGPMVKPYTFEEVVSTLNDVVPYEWGKFLTGRLQSLSPHAPLGGIEKGGWKLVYRDTLSNFEKAEEAVHKGFDMRFSLGIVFADDGTMQDVIPGSVAAKAGLAPGMKLVAVNGRKFSKENLRTEMKSGVKSSEKLEFLVTNGEFYKTHSIDFHGGERYPHLERDASAPDVLSAIIAPVATKSGGKKSR